MTEKQDRIKQKKIYEAPAMEVVEIKSQTNLLDCSCPYPGLNCCEGA